MIRLVELYLLLGPEWALPRLELASDTGVVSQPAAFRLVSIEEPHCFCRFAGGESTSGVLSLRFVSDYADSAEGGGNMRGN